MKRFAILFLALGACASAHVPEPLPVDAGGDPAVLARMVEGRRVYVAKCGACHRLYSVEAYGDAAWEQHVGEMIRLKKLRLAAEERGAILAYLQRLNGRE